MKRRIFAYTFFVAVLFGACKDSFFDINTNPNKPSEESITPDFLMTTVITKTAKRSTTNFDFVAHWMGYWARGSSFGSSVPLENYNITTTYQAAQWSGSAPLYDGWYDILMDNYLMEQKAQETGEEFYIGVAKVIKSIGFMYLVDLYNNVPYSEAFDVVNHIAPKYDKGEDIYKDLLLELDAARTIFAKNLDITDKMATADIVFGGDLDGWRKLTNTQTLRLLIHQSEKVTNPTDEITKITNDGAGFLSAGESAWVNPGYSNNEYKQNPMYGAFVRDHNGSLIDGFNRANNFLLAKYRDNDDIRYQYVFLPAVSPDPEDNLWDGNDFGQSNEAGKSSVNESIVMGKGLVPSAESDAWLITSVESLFLQAEAVQRGWISGTPQDVYEQAVKESFDFLGVEDAEDEATTYLTKPIASWATATDKLELIINQKYLALPGIANFEAWVDYRRLGFPTDVPLSLNSALNGRKIPLRLQYPINEFNFNADNVRAEGDIDPQTNGIWWDVN